MNHPKQDELIVYREGEGSPREREQIAAHLAQCAKCREEIDRLNEMLAAFQEIPVPDAGEDYERRVWRQIAPRLPEKRIRWWSAWLQPQRLAAAGAVAALVIAAFLAGRITKRITPGQEAATTGQVRERVLIVAVGDHLGKSEMVLMELENAQPASAGATLINISAEQRRAEDLVEENRLYRQTALKEGDRAIASTLDELERVLLDIANSPDEVTPAQFEKMRQRIESRGILFKVRVVSKELRERQKTSRAVPAKDNSITKERNKA